MRAQGLAHYAVLGVLVLVVLLGFGVDFFIPKASDTFTKAWVDDDDPSCGGNSPCFQTIQAAIDAIQLQPPRSGTVYIRPGLYREHVVLTKNVELKGVGRELVRLEALDLTKPAIFVKGTYLSGLGGLGIFGGSVGIQVEDAEVFEISYNRIAGYTEAGIRLVRSKISLYHNELPLEDPFRGSLEDPFRGSIAILEGSQALIAGNVVYGELIIQGEESYADIQGNLLGTIRVANGGSASVVRNQLVSALGVFNTGIMVHGEAEATIIANHIQGYSFGIAVIGKADIKNNIILQNEYGIQVGDPVRHFSQPPRFRIAQNRIIANTRWGLALYQGQRLYPHPTDPYAEVYKNWISENGFGYVGGGIEFGSQVRQLRLNLFNNWIINNGLGICPDPNESEKETLRGSKNEIRDNTEDICSDGADYPWPPGFRKP